MKKRDIIILIISFAVIGVSLFFMLRLLFPPKKIDTVTEASTIPTVPTTIDETTYKNVENLSDYGSINLTGLGKSNLFGGF